jgi:hypothetical protein
MGSISFGWAFVAGRKRVPSPAAGKTALRIRIESASVAGRVKKFKQDFYSMFSEKVNNEGHAGARKIRWSSCRFLMGLIDPVPVLGQIDHPDG